MLKRIKSAAGQTSAEYTLVLAGIAIVCVVALVFLGGAIRDQFRSSGNPLDPGPSPGALTPPVPPSGLTWPKTMSDCQGTEWQNFSQFKNSGECRDYVRGLP